MVGGLTSLVQVAKESSSSLTAVDEVHESRRRVLRGVMDIIFPGSVCSNLVGLGTLVHELRSHDRPESLFHVKH